VALSAATSPRRLLAAGAGLTALGIALAGTAPILGTEGSSRTVTQQLAGGVLVLAGWVVLALGIHRFGRGKEE
jgi:uncharacterized membrane protein YidH (DUF202 family)